MSYILILNLRKTHIWWLSVLVLDWWYLSISMLEVSEVKSAFRNLEIKDIITSKIMKLKAQFIYIKIPDPSLRLHLTQKNYMTKSNLPVFCEILVSAWEGLEVESTRNKCFKINNQPIFGSRRQICRNRSRIYLQTLNISKAQECITHVVKFLRSTRFDYIWHKKPICKL